MIITPPADVAPRKLPVRRAASRSSFARAAAFPPRRMSVPRPAMFVAIVTAARRPACATTLASLAASSGRALSTRWGTPKSRARISESSSESATLPVPTSTGWPRAWAEATSRAESAHFASSVAHRRTGSSTRTQGRCGATRCTGTPRPRHSSRAAGAAVPVIPARRPGGYSPRKSDCTVMLLSGCPSQRTGRPSLASSAECRSSVRRDCRRRRPVDSSISTTCRASSSTT